MAKKHTFGSRERQGDAADGNAMGLTEAFHPIASDGFTTAMTPLPDESDESSIAADEVVLGSAGAFEEVDLADEAPVDGEGLAAGESFADEGAFEDFYAGRPLAQAQDIPEAKPLAVISDASATKPATKAKGAGPRHGRHAASVPPEKEGKSSVPEYMRKSRRMRRILIVVIVLLIVLLGVMFYFGFQMLRASGSTAVQQAQNSEQQVDAIGTDDATDAANEAVKTTTVPDP